MSAVITCIDIQSALRLSPVEVQGLLEGRLRIDGTLAHGLANLFGSNIEFWLKRDSDYMAALDKVKT